MNSRISFELKDNSSSMIIDVCLTIIRNNQYSSRTRTVKDYLSFILAIAIGLFRIEDGKNFFLENEYSIMIEF